MITVTCALYWSFSSRAISESGLVVGVHDAGHTVADQRSRNGSRRISVVSGNLFYTNYNFHSNICFYCFYFMVLARGVRPGSGVYSGTGCTVARRYFNSADEITIRLYFEVPS